MSRTGPNPELIYAVRDLAKERGIDPEVLFLAIEEGLVSACKREIGARTTDNMSGEVDRETGEMRVYMVKEVVEEVTDPCLQLSAEEAQQLVGEAFDVGEYLEFEVDPDNFGRLAAQVAKSAISQRLQNAEKERVNAEFSQRIGTLMSGLIQRKGPREVIVDLGRAEAVLQRKEQSKLEHYSQGDRMRFYILRVDDKHSRPTVYISRSHPNLVKRLFEAEVPEIQSGVVEIVQVAREAGSRTKIAVKSNDPNVDPLGACVGPRGVRVNNVMSELRGERIDIILWNEDLRTYVHNALSPAKVTDVELIEHEDGRITAQAYVPENQRSLAIGQEGQNARLAVKLTGYKIDVRSDSELYGSSDIELNNDFYDAFSEEAERLVQRDEADDSVENNVVDSSEENTEDTVDKREFLEKMMASETVDLSELPDLDSLEL